MSAAKKLKRYALIVEKIQQSKFPSLEEIEIFLKRMDLEISERTIQRDIEQIRKDCDISIEYHRTHRGYFIEEDELSKNRIRFLQSQSMTTNFLEFMKENPKHADAIILSNDVNGKGIEYVEQILFAIRSNRQIEFLYQKFWDESPKQFTIQPYALKEFQNRWYLVGILTGQETLFKFGLDRILSFKVSTQKFVKRKEIDVKEHFSRMIGINSENEKREIIRLVFKPVQAKYIETLPLHWSQKMMSTTEKEVVFEYFLIPNYELTQKILSFGDQVKVLQSKWLIAEHKRILRNAMKQY